MTNIITPEMRDEIHRMYHELDTDLAVSDRRSIPLLCRDIEAALVARALKRLETPEKALTKRQRKAIAHAVVCDFRRGVAQLKREGRRMVISTLLHYAELLDVKEVRHG